jgi:type I restriction enzyme S subunit
MSEEELPEGWAEVSLDEVGQWGTGSTPLRSNKAFYASNGFPWITSAATHLPIVTTAEEFVTPAAIAAHRLKKYSVGTLLVAMYGEGKTRGQVTELGIEATTNQACAAVVVDTTKAISAFIRLVLQANYLRMRALAAGGNQPNLSLGTLKRLLVGLPPLAEQRRIVEKVEVLLAEVNAARARLAKVPTILKRLRQSILSAACSGRLTEDWRDASSQEHDARGLLEAILRQRQTHPPSLARQRIPFEAKPPDLEIPSSWEWVSISQVAFLDVGNAFRSSDFANDGIRLLRGENVEPGRLRWADTRYWPRSKLAEFEHLLVQEGDIILAMDRPIVSAGLKLARATSADVPCLLVQRVLRFRLVLRELAGWLNLCLSDSRFRDSLREGGMTGSDLPHITGTGVAEYTIPLPPLPEQHEIVRRVDALFKLADAIEARVAAATACADRLTQAILAKAFRGELCPNEAALARQEGRDYEPASTLLARLRVEREAQPSISEARNQRPNSRPTARKNPTGRPIDNRQKRSRRNRL